MVSPQPESQLFYPKKLTEAVHDMLIAEPLHHEAFLNWWRSKDYYRDFCIETPEYMYRIHVTPRRTSFDPRTWTTSNQTLKTKLLEQLDEDCETIAIPCTTNALPLSHLFQWGDAAPGSWRFLWVGRSRFPRRLKLQTSTGVLPSDPNIPSDVLDPDHLAMEDEQGGAGGHARPDGYPGSQGMDCAGTPIHHLRAEGGSTSQRAQGTLQHEARQVDHQSPRGRNRDSGEAHPGTAYQPLRRSWYCLAGTRATASARCPPATWIGRSQRQPRATTAHRT